MKAKTKTKTFNVEFKVKSKKEKENNPFEYKDNIAKSLDSKKLKQKKINLKFKYFHSINLLI